MGKRHRRGWNSLKVDYTQAESEENANNNTWIFPSNPKVFNAEAAFEILHKMDWKQNSLMKNVKVGDTVYIYEGLPKGAITCKSKVNKVNVEGLEINDFAFYTSNVAIEDYSNEGSFIELEIQRFYKNRELSMEKLHEHGIKGSIMGPRKVNGEIAQYLNQLG